MAGQVTPLVMSVDESKQVQKDATTKDMLTYLTQC